MSEPEPTVEEIARAEEREREVRRAKLSILLIAGVFYLILFAMCATVLVLLIWRSVG